jgi:hypothetical protein
MDLWSLAHLKIRANDLIQRVPEAQRQEIQRREVKAAIIAEVEGLLNRHIRNVYDYIRLMSLDQARILMFKVQEYQSYNLEDPTCLEDMLAGRIQKLAALKNDERYTEAVKAMNDERYTEAVKAMYYAYRKVRSTAAGGFNGMILLVALMAVLDAAMIQQIG